MRWWVPYQSELGVSMPLTDRNNLAVPVRRAGNVLCRVYRLSARICITVCCAGMTAFCSAETDRLIRVSNARAGTSAADLTSALGQPSVDRPVPKPPDGTLCGGDTRNVREFVYEERVGFFGRLMMRLGRQPYSSFVVVCLDD